MSTSLTDVKDMSDTTMLFLDLAPTRKGSQADPNKELKWLQRMIKFGTLQRHWYLRRRRHRNQGIPWWTSQETQISWKRFQVFEMVCTTRNVWTLLMNGAVTAHEVRQFYLHQPLTPVPYNNMERAVAMYEGKEDYLQTLEGALAHPELWCSIMVATTIRNAVDSGEFSRLWDTGYFDSPSNYNLLNMLEEACFIDRRFLASLHDPVDGPCIAAGIAVTKLNWYQLVNLFAQRELA